MRSRTDSARTKRMRQNDKTLSIKWLGSAERYVRRLSSSGQSVDDRFDRHCNV